MSRREREPSEAVAEILAEGDRGEGPVLRLPSSVATGRYAVSRKAVLGVLLVVVVAVAVLGGRYLLAKGEAAPRPQATVAEEADEGAFADPAAEEGAVDEAAEVPAAAGTPPPSGKVTVHVAGRVADPGVVTLSAGSRVDDALAAAGGTKGDADLAAINLARPLVDGEQVYVPEPGEAGGGAAVPGGEAAAAGAAPPGGAAAGGSAAGGKVDLNSADVTTLETLPGVGPVLAQRIVDWRTEHGGFSSVDELGEVSGIGEKTFADLAPEVTV